MSEKKETQEETKKNKLKITLPFVVVIAGVLVTIISLLLPYMTAVGKLDEYIEKHPDVILEDTLGLTTGEFAKVSVISIGNLVTSVYGQDNGTFTNAIILVFGGLLALTALFAIFKKPIAIMIFDLLAYGAFFVLNHLTKELFIAADKYARGIGYYTMLIAIVAIFVGAVWMLVNKIMIKRQAKKTMVFDSIE